jgi:protein tyrosine phosphatase (PTP) superfamily phosphohydrolase (DUF442 family)
MLNEIYNYLQLGDSLHSSGMPTPEQASSLAQDGIKVVINLATPKSENWMPDEQERVKAQNIAYYNIPVDWDSPAKDDLTKFMAIMDRHKHQKILVHCQANYRATVFIALYRYSFLGWSEKNAFKEVQEIWDPSEYPIWQKFIEKSLRSQS